VALFIWHQLLGNPRTVNPLDQQHGSLLGPRFTAEEIQRFLDGLGAKYHRWDDEHELCDRVAELIAQEKVVGWLQGRMEFGPRALGGRSILGDARSPRMQAVMNLKIKFRESFRPFAPSVLAERAEEFFELPTNQHIKNKLFDETLKNIKRLVAAEAEPQRSGVDQLRTLRSVIPAVTHVDYSARVQTVDPQRHPRYWRLLKQFEAKTGCPVLINTSFNVRGEPIVCTPEHAYRCFMATNMDALVLENFVLLKAEQPGARQYPLDDYLAQFALD